MQSGGIEAMASSEPHGRFFLAGVIPGLGCVRIHSPSLLAQQMTPRPGCCRMLVTPVKGWSTLGCAGSVRSRTLTVSVGLSALGMPPLALLSGTAAMPTSGLTISSLPAVASFEETLRFTKLGAAGLVTSTTVKPCRDAFWTYR